MMRRSKESNTVADGGLPLGHLERNALEILWDCGECNVHEVVRRLSRPLAYTTVMTTLDRLFKKGLLERRKSERAFLYSPRWSKREWERKRAGDWVAAFLSGFAALRRNVDLLPGGRGRPAGRGPSRRVGKEDPDETPGTGAEGPNMTLPYLFRLLCLCLACFFVVHLAAGLAVGLCARAAVPQGRAPQAPRRRPVVALLAAAAGRSRAGRRRGTLRAQLSVARASHGLQ